MQSLRNGAVGGFLKYFLFTLLGLAMGGLVLMDQNGVMSGGVGRNDVAKVGSETITLREFDGAFRRSLARFNGISAQQAHAMGLSSQVLSGEIQSRFLESEAKNAGIALSKDELATRLAAIVRPQMKDGETMQETLNTLLRYQGLTEKEFISLVRREVASDLLMNAIQNGYSSDNTALAEELYAFQSHTRDIEMIVFNDADITEIEPASEEQLRKLYDSVKHLNYKIPEYRTVQVASFDPSNLQIDVTISDAEVRKAYDDNQDAFMQGEQIVLSQAIVKDQETARKVFNAAKDGKSLEAAATEFGGEDARYLDQVPFSASSMIPAIAEVIEGKDIGTLSEPVRTTLGFHVVKLEKVIPEALKPFDTVKQQILTELSQEKKGDLLFEATTRFEEMLEDGKAFDEIAKDVPIQISALGPIDNIGLDKDGVSALSAYDENDAQLITEAIFELTDGEPSLLQELPSGQYMAFIVTDKQEQSFKPFESVKDKIAEQFMKDQKHAENNAIVSKYVAELSTGGRDFAAIAKDSGKAVKAVKGIALEGEIEKPLSDKARPVIFQTDLGQSDVYEHEDGFVMIRVTGYDVPEVDTSVKQDAVAALKNKLDEEMREEALLSYLHHLSVKYPAQVNEALLDRAYGDQGQ